MSIKDVKNAFSLLVPRTVGTTDGGQARIRPSVRAFLIALLANGRGVILNSEIQLGVIYGNRMKPGSVVCFNRFYSGDKEAGNLS